MFLTKIFIFFLLYLFYRGITVDLKFSRLQKRWLVLILLSGILVLIAGKSIDHMSFIGSVSTGLGLFVLAFIFYILCSLVTVLFRAYRQRIVFTTLVLFILVSVYSVFNAMSLPRVKEITIRVNKLPAKLQGFTIVQLSDLHLGGVAKPIWLEQVVDKVNRLQPDLIAITGDLIEGYSHIEDWQEYADALKRLRTGHGIFAVTGNHDVQKGGKHFYWLAREAGITVLDNRFISAAGGIQIAGICDPDGEEKPNIAKALKNIDRSLPVIFLSHRPDFFRTSRNYGIDLQLSGHTHAGQIPPVNFFISLLYHYPYGLYHEDGAYIYTSCGTSVMNMPMRLLSTNEIVRFTLLKKIPDG